LSAFRKRRVKKDAQWNGKNLWTVPPLYFTRIASAVESSVREICEGLPQTEKDGELYKYMISGAGHDSCYTNRRFPTSMIFVPTKGASVITRKNIAVLKIGE